jgi:predicted 3-demethylubiquinone-9 3-methyltransferase (glyoxalase superfamily)
MQNVSTCLWFNDQAEPAAKLYASLFPDSRILETAYYGENMPMPKGTVMVVRFALAGRPCNAVGSPIDSVCPGKSCPRSCRASYRARTVRARSGWRRP